jgi:hypothetical protein
MGTDGNRPGDRMTPELADYMARAFVCGLVEQVLVDGTLTGKKVVQSGRWHTRFVGHPYVDAADAEGWARDLRTAVIAETRRRIMAKEAYHDVNLLMPDAGWIKHQRAMAEKYAAAKKWRDEVTESHGGVDDWLRKSRGGRNDIKPLAVPMRDIFEAMQRNSPNAKRLHVNPLVELTPRTRRMMGDDE